MPTGSLKPSIVSSTKVRIGMELQRLKAKFNMVWRSMYIKFWHASVMRPRVKLEWHRLSGIGLDLYKQMNEGFAA